MSTRGFRRLTRMLFARRPPINPLNPFAALPDGVATERNDFVR